MFKQKKYRLGPKETLSFITRKEESITASYRRVQARVDIPLHGVKAGDFGGYVGGKYVLSHEGSCWVGGNAIVDKTSKVLRNALVKDNAKCFTYSTVSDNSIISSEAELKLSEVYEEVMVSGKSSIDYSELSGNITISDLAEVVSIRALGNIIIKDNAILGRVPLNRDTDKSNISTRENEEIIISKNAKILRDSNVFRLQGNCLITDDVHIHSSDLSGNITVTGRAGIFGAKLSGDIVVSDDSQILLNSEVSGKSRISGTSIVPPNFRQENIVIHNQAASYELLATSSKALSSSGTQALVSSGGTSFYAQAIMDIEEEYNSYANDVVKLLKYPAMVDTSIPETQNFVLALRASQRALKTQDEEILKEAFQSLEKAFVVAENHAQTLSLSHLDDKKKTSLRNANQFLAKACDEASTDNEKKISFKAGFKELEGVVPVSDQAISLFKERTGLLELEA